MPLGPKWTRPWGCMFHIVLDREKLKKSSSLKSQDFWYVVSSSGPLPRLLKNYAPGTLGQPHGSHVYHRLIFGKPKKMFLSYINFMLSFIESAVRSIIKAVWWARWCFPWPYEQTFSGERPRALGPSCFLNLICNEHTMLKTDMKTTLFSGITDCSGGNLLRLSACPQQIQSVIGKWAIA